MSTPHNDQDLGLARLDPIEPPADVWDAAVSVAVDPDTPAPDDSLLPDANVEPDDASLSDDAALDAADIDLSEFDDDNADDDPDTPTDVDVHVDVDPHAADPHGIDPHGIDPHGVDIVHPTFTEVDPLPESPAYDENADFSPEHQVEHDFHAAGGTDGFDGGAHDADIPDL